MVFYEIPSLSNFSFCSLAWHFCSESSTRKMEKIQERALRFVYNDYKSSATDLLTKAKLPTLHVRRTRTMALEVFKIMHGLAPPVLSSLIVKRDNKYNFRYTNILQIPQVKTSTYGKNSFGYAAPVLWNSLPENFRTTTNFNNFKNLMENWNGNHCKCVACQQGWGSAGQG